MTEQPIALRLADEYYNGDWISATNQWREEAAAELRRLHAENTALKEHAALQRQEQDEPVAWAGYDLDGMVDVWAEASGNQFHHGETLRGVSKDDLLTLAASVEAATREQCAQMVAGEKFRDGKQDARRGPGGVGTWHESSPMGFVMRELARLIRAA